MKTKSPGELLADESYVREAFLTTCYQTIPIPITIPMPIPIPKLDFNFFLQTTN